jgi:HD-GYP domain-containing protein (c-di-GMP phosphodiesterase class II)
MVSERAYAVARSSGEALEEIQRCAGTQFDAAVVAAFAATLEDRLRPPAGIAV